MTIAYAIGYWHFRSYQKSGLRALNYGCSLLSAASPFLKAVINNIYRPVTKNTRISNFIYLIPQ